MVHASSLRDKKIASKCNPSFTTRPETMHAWLAVPSAKSGHHLPSLASAAAACAFFFLERALDNPPWSSKGARFGLCVALSCASASLDMLRTIVAAPSLVFPLR